MVIKYIAVGFLAKTIASFDDLITKIPIIAYLTKTHKGRIAFAIGNLLAVTLAILIAIIFSELLSFLPYPNLIISFLILLLAFFLYFDFFSPKRQKQITREENKMIKQPSFTKLISLIFTGFIISFITLIDDFIVLTPLFMNSLQISIYAIIGIYISTIGLLVVAIFFSTQISKLKYLKEASALGMIILAILVAFRIF